MDRSGVVVDSATLAPPPMFEPWERLLLLSIELHDLPDTPECRALKCARRRAGVP